MADYAIFLITLYDIIFQWWSYIHNLLPLQTLIVMEHSRPCPLYSRAQHLPYYPNGRGAPGALPYNMTWTGLTTGLTIPYKRHGANNCKDLQIVKAVYPQWILGPQQILEPKCCTTTHSSSKTWIHFLIGTHKVMISPPPRTSLFLLVPPIFLIYWVTNGDV